MKGSNALNSHNGERRSHRADKMSGSTKTHNKGKSQKFLKKFTNKKRRIFLRDHNEKF